MDKVFRNIFWLISLFLVLFLPYISQDFGITFDEWNMANGGVHVLRYLFSGGQDLDILTFYLTCGQHPQFFYSLVGAVYGVLSGSLSLFLSEGLHVEKNILPFFELSHRINALFGFVTILYAGRTAKEIGGWRVGVMTMLIMALSPRFFGHLMNNSKDIPFAAAYSAAMFYSIRFFKSFPVYQLKTIACLAVAIALSIGVRVGGFLLLCYLPLFGGLFWITQNNLRENRGNIFLLSGVLFGIFVASYAGGLIFWPMAIQEPLTYPLKALQHMSNFVEWDGDVLFEGKQISASQLPWYYLPKWIAISVPLVTIAGWGCLLAFSKKIRSYGDWRLLSFVLFIALFPIAYIIIKDSIVYDGWRHVLFTYAPLCVLAAVGWDLVFKFFETNRKKSFLRWFFVVLLLSPIPWMVRNHPNQVVYFNPLVGGINGAFGNYETDYFGNSIREASEWLIEYHEKNNPYRPLIVRADLHPMSSYPYLRNKFNFWYFPFGYRQNFLKSYPYSLIGFGPYLQGPKGWDYAIVTSRGWEKEVLEKSWPPKGTIHTVKADDTILCAVVKSPDSKLK